MTEICTDQNLAAGSPLECTVLCDEGFTVISGGFECNFTGATGAAPTDPCTALVGIQESRPASLGAGWIATWRNEGDMSIEVTTWAYCAEVEGCSVSNPQLCDPPDTP